MLITGEINFNFLLNYKNMPLPKPKPGENRNDFIGRCVTDAVMQREFPQQDQRLVICYLQFRGKK